MEENSGWIKLHRKFLKWEWFDSAKTVQLFIYLLLSANHEDKKWHGILVKRGQLVTGLRSIKSQTKLSMRSIRTSLTRLKTTHEVTQETTHRYSLITIEKYDEYQAIPEKTTHKTTRKTTNEGHTNDNNQEVKEVKEVKETTLAGSSPANNGEYKVRQDPNSILVIFWKTQIEQVELQDRSWDKLNWGRVSKCCKTLLDAFDHDLEKVRECMLAVVKHQQSRNLDWSPQTVVKLASQWMSNPYFERPRVRESSSGNLTRLTEYRDPWKQS